MPRMISRRMLSISAAVLAMLAAPACIHFSRANAFQKATSPGEYEKQMWEHVQKGHALDLRAQMAETFHCNLPNGAMSREEWLDFLGSTKLTGFQIENLKSAPNGADMVVTYDLTLQGTSRGQAIPAQKLHVLTVWQSVKRGWIEVAQAINPEGQWPSGPGATGRP
jgi:hypothetical protein